LLISDVSLVAVACSLRSSSSSFDIMSSKTKADTTGAPSPKKAKTDKPKVVLAYSGGLDTSVILLWLIEKVSKGFLLLPP